MEHHFKSADLVDAFDWAIGEAIGRLVPTTVLCSRYGDMQWFDASCWRAYNGKQTAYCAWWRARSADHWGQFVLACAEAQMAYSAAKESHNEWTRNTQKHSTCSHNWWETLKRSIFGVKPSIPTLRGFGGGLVVAPAEKALLVSGFVIKQCCKLFVTPLSGFLQSPQSRCNSLASRLLCFFICF